MFAQTGFAYHVDNPSRGGRDVAASVLLYALIHRLAENGDSREYKSSLPHSPGPIGSAAVLARIDREMAKIVYCAWLIL